MGVEASAEVALHQPVKELDVLGEGPGQLLGAAVPIRHGDGAEELPVIEGVVDPRSGDRRQVGVLDPLPQAEELGHGLDQAHGLGPKQHRQLPDGLLPAAVELHLVFYRGPVFVFQGAFQRHAGGIGRKEGHQVPAGTQQLLDGAQHIVDPPLRRGVAHIFRQDLVDKAGAVGTHSVGHGVHLPHHLVVQHQTVQCLFHGLSFQDLP